MVAAASTLGPSFLPWTVYGIPQQGCVRRPACIIQGFPRVPSYEVWPSRSWGWVPTVRGQSLPQPGEMAVSLGHKGRWRSKKEKLIGGNVMILSFVLALLMLRTACPGCSGALVFQRCSAFTPFLHLVAPALTPTWRRVPPSVTVGDAWCLHACSVTSCHCTKKNDAELAGFGLWFLILASEIPIWVYSFHSLELIKGPVCTAISLANGTSKIIEVPSGTVHMTLHCLSARLR